MATGKFLALALASAALVAAGPAFAGDADEGKKLFKKHLCFACHKLKPGKNGVGPTLAGVWGQEAANADGFKYTKALSESGIVWNEETMDEWVQNPKAMVKGTKMILAKPVKNAEDRADLISYLEEATSE
ncbi:MAG: c-type cytochrome [Alphaproteobacteria bacterium]